MKQAFFGKGSIPKILMAKKEAKSHVRQKRTL
jgi:hypothetical protein